MFGVPDEIKDMTRSLEIVERERLIYWMKVFGHRNGFGTFRIFIGVPRGYRNPPGKVLGLMGHRGERGQPIRGWRMTPRGV